MTAAYRDQREHPSQAEEALRRAIEAQPEPDRKVPTNRADRREAIQRWKW